MESLQNTFHELIPISQAMGVSVFDYDGETLTITAPLAANINHQHSAFGGSLFAVAALAGWGLMQLKLSELLLDCNTVVMGGEVAYHRPVYDDLQCSVKLPAGSAAMFETLANEGTVQMELSSSILANDKPAMQLSGRYHLKMRKQSD